MTTFELTIESVDAKALRLLVAADHWVEAWQEGLAVMGDPPDPQDASCVIDDAIARIDVPSTGRMYVVRAMLKEPTAGPRPEPGKPVLLTGADGGVAGGAPIRVKRGRSADMTVPDMPPQGIRPDDDPVARVLSDLERQRLGARPMRIDKHGMPQLVERPRPGARQVTPQGVPRVNAPPEADTARRSRTRDDTLAFTPAMPSGPDVLPQMFRPVAATGATDPAMPLPRLALLQWAVDTAWSHTPCEVALLLEGLDGDGMPEVALARGEREREVRGCRVPLEHAFRQAACRAPTRVRFAERVGIRFMRADDQSLDLAVESTLCAPIVFVPGHDTPSTFGLGLVLLNSARTTGFTDSELRALTYLARTLAERLDALG